MDGWVWMGGWMEGRIMKSINYSVSSVIHSSQKEKLDIKEICKQYRTVQKEVYIVEARDGRHLGGQ